jgi:hypothetical protein
MTKPPRTVLTGWTRNSNEVTTPKLPPPPLSAQNKSSFSLPLATRGFPSAVTISSDRTLSQVRPYFLTSQPTPPPSVSPAMPVLDITLLGQPSQRHGFPDPHHEALLQPALWHCGSSRRHESPSCQIGQLRSRHRKAPSRIHCGHHRAPRPVVHFRVRIVVGDEWFGVFSSTLFGATNRTAVGRRFDPRPTLYWAKFCALIKCFA